MTTDAIATRPAGATALARMDPQTLIAQAIEKGAGMDTLERLVALAKDVRAELAREKWHEAMADFQADCPPIYKRRTAQTRTYAYDYASLDDCLAVVQPVMGRVGLSVSWRMGEISDKAVTVFCRIAHQAGHVEESGAFTIPIALAQDGTGATPAQKVGGAVTYAKRYSLLAAIGKAAEDDPDAADAAEPADRAATRDRHAPEPTRDPHERDVPGTHGGDAPITPDQLKRFHAIAGQAKWSDEQKHELLSGYQIESSAAIPMRLYNTLIDKLKLGPEKALKANGKQQSLA
jgi:hypothetical protein